jgi:hypothetical protein
VGEVALGTTGRPSLGDEVVEAGDRRGRECRAALETELLAEPLVGEHQAPGHREDGETDRCRVRQGEVVAVDRVAERPAGVAHRGGDEQPADPVHVQGVGQLDVHVVHDGAVGGVEDPTAEAGPLLGA